MYRGNLTATRFKSRNSVKQNRMKKYGGQLSRAALFKLFSSRISPQDAAHHPNERPPPHTALSHLPAVFLCGARPANSPQHAGFIANPRRDLHHSYRSKCDSGLNKQFPRAEFKRFSSQRHEFFNFSAGFPGTILNVLLVFKNRRARREIWAFCASFRGIRPGVQASPIRPFAGLSRGLAVPGSRRGRNLSRSGKP